MSRLAPILLAAALFTLSAATGWHGEPQVRLAVGIVLATLVLWISEVAPLGVVALLIPVAANFTGILTWKDAVVSWADPIIFLFLGAFLLARALDKHGVFDGLIRRFEAGALQRDRAGLRLSLFVLAIAGALSTVQSNTAVAAMLLPPVTLLARRTRLPALPLLALSFGATFGGMATPVGTPPNFLGYARMKELDSAVSFVSWLWVGVPIWLGATGIAWGLLYAVETILVRRRRAGDMRPIVDISPRFMPVRQPEPVGAEEPLPLEDAPEGWHGLAKPGRGSRAARRWAIGAFAATATAWLTGGIVLSVSAAGSPAQHWFNTYLPESLVPVAAAGVLFVVRPGRGAASKDRLKAAAPVLDRHDFQALDWDTLFLIAGGLCLGNVLQTSGAGAALAHAVVSAHLPPLAVLCALAFATVLLSELTSNTATASLMVPIAGSLAAAAGVSPVQAIWLVALSASLGFALPVSTPPNALVYGTRLIPLRLMIAVGVLVDLLSTAWVVACVYWLG